MTKADGSLPPDFKSFPPTSRGLKNSCSLRLNRPVVNHEFTLSLGMRDNTGSYSASEALRSLTENAMGRRLKDLLSEDLKSLAPYPGDGPSHPSL